MANFQDILKKFAVPDEAPQTEIPYESYNDMIQAEPEVQAVEQFAGSRSPAIVPNENFRAPASAPEYDGQEPQNSARTENSEARLERLMQDLKSNRTRDLEDARSRQMKANMLQGVISNLGLLVGGAQAANTKNAVTAPNVKGIEVGDLEAKVERQNKPEMDSLLAQYKLLQQQKAKANQSLTPYQMAMLGLNNRRLEQQDQNFQEGEDRRNEENFEKKIQKVGDKLGNAQDIYGAIDNIESKLGFKLDDVDADDGSLKVKGKAVDLPGVSLPGLGRVTAFSGDARKLQSAVSKVFNTELKDRSGSAVTSPELDRLKEEFASGKFNTEAELASALKDYKKLIAHELKNREAAFQPEVLEEYRSRGGATSDRLAQPSQSEQTKVVNGVTYKKVPGGWQRQ